MEAASLSVRVGGPASHLEEKVARTPQQPGARTSPTQLPHFDSQHQRSAPQATCDSSPVSTPLLV
jgi:hypothetical protein